MKKCGKLGGCMGAPMRALSRACDSACDLYVRGMSGCARRVPSGAAGAVGRGFGRTASASLILRTSSDRAEDLVRAASRQQRRVAAEPAPGQVVDQAVKVPARKKGAAAMGAIAENAPCEFDADGGCAAVPSPKTPRRRGGTSGGLASRPGGFGAIKAGREAFAR
ncbi:uncharacterized protein LOC133910108 [Phragmites australis]|uniref:uncharacterized protein LOC133910108 n=1 Tax=Phragmites australis TaxID=29695 RepID=UPI002D79F360|nr:uncharacterized protein LOC133910108 [Phragmites australis]